MICDKCNKESGLLWVGEGQLLCLECDFFSNGAGSSTIPISQTPEEDKGLFPPTQYLDYCIVIRKEFS